MLAKCCKGDKEFNLCEPEAKLPAAAPVFDIEREIDESTSCLYILHFESSPLTFSVLVIYVQENNQNV